jgi:hypothetical protein
MHVHPDIAALRTDRGPQRHAQAGMQAACQAWGADPGAAAVLRELEKFGAGAALEECPALKSVFTGVGEAERLARLLSQHFVRALAENPYGHPPFRNGYDGHASSMMLARSGRAQIMLQSREPARLEHQSFVYSDVVRYDAVIAGSAVGRIARIAREGGSASAAEFAFEDIALTPGSRFAFELNSEALLVDRVDRRLVMLRLVRQAEAPVPSREFDAGSGTLHIQCAGSLATSRQEAIIALLGRMGRSDAAPAMAKVALGAGDISLRWQGLRECLALDSAQGFRALAEIARRTGDPLAGHAGALRAQLVENHPEFLVLEAEQCPA